MPDLCLVYDILMFHYLFIACDLLTVQDLFIAFALINVYDFFMNLRFMRTHLYSNLYENFVDGQFLPYDTC